MGQTLTRTSYIKILQLHWIVLKQKYGEIVGSWNNCCAIIVLHTNGHSLSVDSLYSCENEEVLVNGVDKFKHVKLNTTVYFYGNTYDQLYVSVNHFCFNEIEYLF